MEEKRSARWLRRLRLKWFRPGVNKCYTKCHCKWAGRKGERKDEEKGLTFHTSILLHRQNCTSSWCPCLAPLHVNEEENVGEHVSTLLQTKVQCYAANQQAQLGWYLKRLCVLVTAESAVSLAAASIWKGRVNFHLAVTSTKRKLWCFSYCSVPLYCQRMHFRRI